MLLEGFSQLGHLAGELLALLWGALQLGQSLPGLFVVVERVGHEVLGLLALPENREEVLLFQPHLQLQLLLQFREQALAGLDRVAGCLGKFGKELGRLGGTGLDQLSDGWHSGLQRTAWKGTPLPFSYASMMSDVALDYEAPEAASREQRGFVPQRNMPAQPCDSPRVPWNLLF